MQTLAAEEGNRAAGTACPTKERAGKWGHMLWWRGLASDPRGSEGEGVPRCKPVSIASQQKLKPTDTCILDLNPTATLVEHMLLTQGFMGTSTVSFPHHWRPQHHDSTWPNLVDTLK